MNHCDFSYEKKFWKQGYKIVAGVDEVGRGCFAGPVVAGCVVFTPDTRYKIPDTIRIDDSKKLRPRQREKGAKWIKENALTWGIGEASSTLINRIGMGLATKVAFRKAIAKANLRLKAKSFKHSAISFLLIDAFYIPYVKGLRRKNQKAIINGDEKSISIAAASIIAKVYRDKLMRRLSKQSKYKGYGWERNKGYGTREHQNAIVKYGVTRLHRKQFISRLITQN